MSEKFDPKPYIKLKRMTSAESDKKYVEKPSAEELKIKEELKHVFKADEYIAEIEERRIKEEIKSNKAKADKVRH